LGTRFYDRVVFDTWSRHNFVNTPEILPTTTLLGNVLEQGGAGFMYPKPASGPQDLTRTVQYDNGIPLNVTTQDLTGFTTFPAIGVHPFFTRINNLASLTDLLNRHQPVGYTTSWQPTPGLRDQTTIPMFSNSYAAVTPPVYFPKGPRIYSIQVSIRLYDEKSKSAKEFRLISRL